MHKNDEFPSKYLNEFLDYIETSEKEFHDVLDKHRSPHIWTKVNGDWKLRHTVAKDGVDDK